MKKYRTGDYLSESMIVEVEVIKETATQIVISYPTKGKDGSMTTRECREQKVSGARITHDTYEEARSHLVARAATGLHAAEHRRERAKDHSDQVSKLPEHKEEQP